MQSTFTILISEAQKGSWPDVVWSDAKDDGAKVYLDYCRPMNRKLRELRKIHFSNHANRKVWLPLKCLWDWSNVLRIEELVPRKRNYVIFQTGIKYSAYYIRKLKKERNACIVLYMPDNIRTMGIANNRAEFERYCRHFQIDQVYSFDKRDCEEFDMEFFDLYSKLPMKEITEKRKSGRLRVLYVGSCRSKERLETVHRLYDKLQGQADCLFYLNGVHEADMTRKGVIYNHPLTYVQVVDLVQKSDVIIEIMNGEQTGNTLRLKEAVCYNKLLLTNNRAVENYPNYNSVYMQIFSDVENVDLTKFQPHAEYNCHGEFSPALLLARIKERDNFKGL